MPTNSTSKHTESRGKREAQREKTRARILQAVLDTMVEKGVRGVRHRAVAKRAGVSLGSTTYHFSSIEELIISYADKFYSKSNGSEESEKSAATIKKEIMKFGSDKIERFEIWHTFLGAAL